jgi:hypothetical protein
MDWGEGKTRMGSHMVGRLAAEFLSLDWIVKNVITGPLGTAVYERLRTANAENL